MKLLDLRRILNRYPPSSRPIDIDRYDVHVIESTNTNEPVLAVFEDGNKVAEYSLR